MQSFFDLVCKINNSSYTIDENNLNKRGAYLGKSMLHIIAGCGDSIASIAISSLNLLTLNTYQKVYVIANNFTLGFRECLSASYLNFIQAVYPNAKFSRRASSDDPYIHRVFFYDRNTSKDPYIWADGDGFLPEYTTRELRYLARDMKASNMFNRHITARALHILSLMIAPFTRLGDCVISFVAVPLSVISKGKVESINNLAYRTLQFPGIIFDVHYFGSHILNPGDFVF